MDVGVWISEGPLYSVLSFNAVIVDHPLGGGWVKGGKTQVMNMQKQRLYVHTTDMTLRYTSFLLGNYSPPFLLGYHNSNCSNAKYYYCCLSLHAGFCRTKDLRIPIILPEIVEQWASRTTASVPVYNALPWTTN